VPVEVTDDLPADTSFVSAEGDGWTCGEADGVVTCTSSGPLGVGEHVITVVVSTDPGFAGGTIENCATVTAGDTPEIEAADVGPSCVTTQVDPALSPDVVVNPPVEEAPVTEPAAAGALAFTGSNDSVPLAAIGIALLGLGAALVLFARNRRASEA
jgi:LPXTG-motif cell wall-anchored protein